MDAEDTVKAFMTALEANEQETVTNTLTEQFLFEGWTPQPLDKQGFLATMGGLKEGMPGLIFNLHNVAAPDVTTVTGTLQITGYQSDGFILPPLSLPPIPQMGRSVSLPTEDVTYTIEDDHIARMHVARVPGGGIQGLLHQLGVDAPIIQ